MNLHQHLPHRSRLLSYLKLLYFESPKGHSYSYTESSSDPTTLSMNCKISVVKHQGRASLARRKPFKHWPTSNRDGCKIKSYEITFNILQEKNKLQLLFCQHKYILHQTFISLIQISVLEKITQNNSAMTECEIVDYNARMKQDFQQLRSALEKLKKEKETLQCAVIGISVMDTREKSVSRCKLDSAVIYMIL